MKPGETKTTVEEESYYVVAVTLRCSNWNPATRRHDYFDRPSFFKADRYSVYGGRLQTEHSVEDARRWKMPEGAHAAVKRLVEKHTIKAEHKPVVCKYTKTLTRSETLVVVPE